MKFIGSKSRDSKGERPAHQIDRGPRFGNTRKMWAGIKVKKRRAEKRAARSEVIREKEAA